MSEWLTDKEKRLLFSALTREKKVCAEVDRESCREPYEESLVSVIESLEHKFYYDRLFKQIEKQIRADAIDEVSIRVKALELLLDWSEECGFGLDSFPNEYEQYKHTLVEDMSYKDMMIKIAECVIAEQLKQKS